MPIVDVEIVLGPNEILRKEIAAELADELGVIFQASQGGTWIKVHELSSDQYAENGGAQNATYPIFVTVIKSKFPVVEEMQKEVEKITGAVAQICGRPSENVHMIYQPAGSSRVAFGGRIVW